jgi:short subunit dehydrogenase-like uncharacterized protein
MALSAVDCYGGDNTQCHHYEQASDMTEHRTEEIWLLGATGRTGKAIGALLVAAGHPPVLVGRNPDRLRSAAAAMGVDGPRLVVADSVEGIVQAIREQKPLVVVNTIGGYAETAARIARACLPGGNYVDLANDLVAIPRLLELNDEAIDGGSSFVTGAGFGVLGTQSVVAKLCEGKPTPSRVRVDAVPSLAIEAVPVGDALAESIVSGMTTGGLRYQDGRLVRARLASSQQRLTLPASESAGSAGEVVGCGLAPLGDLIAAQLASGAPEVVATSAMLPTGFVRHLLPLVGRIVSISAVRKFAVRRLSAVMPKAAPRPREHTWAHAVVSWPDGTTREGWLRCDDAMDFTCSVVAEAALALARGEAKPGAWTPAMAFGADLAIAAGGTFILD